MEIFPLTSGEIGSGSPVVQSGAWAPVPVAGGPFSMSVVVEGLPLSWNPKWTQPGEFTEPDWSAGKGRWPDVCVTCDVTKAVEAAMTAQTGVELK